MTGLIPDTTYYVRAYASNSNGINYGNELSFTTTNMVGTVPCTIADNKLQLVGLNNNYIYNSVIFTTSSGSLIVGDVGFTASGSGSDLRIEFDIIPETGIYQTANIDVNIPNGKCIVNGTFFNQGYRAAAGHDVYVEKMSDGVYRMSFCDVPFGTGDPSFPSFNADANLSN